MTEFHCLEVNTSWERNANPDNLSVKLVFGRTSHEFYPSTREIFFLYDAVVNGRDETMVVGTGDTISLTHDDPSPDMITFDWSLLRFVESRAEMTAGLKDLLVEIIAEKDARSTPAERDEGLTSIQRWIDDRGGSISVRDVYNELSVAEET